MGGCRSKDGIGCGLTISRNKIGSESKEIRKRGGSGLFFKNRGQSSFPKTGRAL